VTWPSPGWLVAWVGDEQSAVLEVTAAGEAAAAVGAHVAALVDVQAASRLAAQDISLWGATHRPTVAGRLGWVDLPESSRATVERLEVLRADLAAEGVVQVVVHDLRGAEPGAPVGAVVDDPTAAIVVLAGSADATLLESLGREVAAAAARVVVVADAGGEAARWASSQRALFLTDPLVDGPFAALDAAALVPAALAGAAVSELLDDAAIVSDLVAEDAEGNPALVLAASLAGTRPLRRTVLLVDEGSGLPGLADWVARLVSTATGLVPVVAETQGEAQARTADADVLVVRLLSATDEPSDDLVGVGDEPSHASVSVTGTLGSQILLWQYAAAVAARLLGRSPFGSLQPAEPARVKPDIAPADETPAAEEGTEDA
jgi:glucose-6-phosphate isomerase